MFAKYKKNRAAMGIKITFVFYSHTCYIPTAEKKKPTADNIWKKVQ